MDGIKGITGAWTGAEIFVPDGCAEAEALARTTHLGIGAHHDDLEIMAIDGILRAYERLDAWFTGVVVTDGAGAPRAGDYASFSDDEMKRRRAEEQKEAARLGRYSAQILLAHPSASVKSPDAAVTGELTAILQACRPEIVYTHNLWDKHDTHVAVALRTIDAIRALPPDARPRQVHGVEVWRDLDWLPDDAKTVFDCSGHEQLQSALLAVFDSQIAGGKRYDLAIMGRRRAHATYHEPHTVDRMTGAAYGVDMTPLIKNETLDPADFAQNLLEAFREDVRQRLHRMR